MFDWLKRIAPHQSGMAEILRRFGQMLEDGRHIFDAASNALLGGTDPKVVAEDIWATDKRINHSERKIRRLVVTHGTIHGTGELPICLALMSIVKDAERIGDYAKNIFDLAYAGASVLDGSRDDLVKLKDTVSRMLVKARNIYEAQDEEGATAFLEQADALADHCDARVLELLQRAEGGGQLAATALAYRYDKRVVAHAQNIITSVVMPLDRLDYYDERKQDRD